MLTWGIPNLVVEAMGLDKKLIIEAHDDTTGIARVVYRYKSASGTAWSTEFRVPTTNYDGTPMDFSRVGIYTVKATAYDGAGNSTTVELPETTFGAPEGSDTDGSGGVGSITVPGSNGPLPDGINVFRETNPMVEFVIINGKDSNGAQFDKKVLEDIFNGK